MKLRTLILTASLVLMAIGVSQGQCEFPPELPQERGFYLESVDGIALEPDTFYYGSDLTFNFRIVGDENAHGMLNNGFNFCSDVMEWEDIDTAFITDFHEDPEFVWNWWFDFLCKLDHSAIVSVNTAGCDTVGLALLWMSGSGLPACHNEVSFSVTLKGITGADTAQLVVDSCWYRPSNPWMWDVCGADVGWGGPYTVVGIPDPTGVAFLDGANLPTAFALKQNYPNPFNPNTEMMFDVPRRCNVTISVYNILGHKVKTLVDKELAAGSYVASWDGTNKLGKPVSSGMYFYRMEADGYLHTKKMMLIK